jgi:hypothetical protein
MTKCWDFVTVDCSDCTTKLSATVSYTVQHDHLSFQVEFVIHRRADLLTLAVKDSRNSQGRIFEFWVWLLLYGRELTQPLRQGNSKKSIRVMTTPWYRKVYKGAEAQKLWQAGAGVGLLLVFVILPTSMQYTVEEMKKTKLGRASHAQLKDDLQRQVYEEGLELRRRLLEMPSPNVKANIENRK